MRTYIYTMGKPKLNYNLFIYLIITNIYILYIYVYYSNIYMYIIMNVYLRKQCTRDSVNTDIVLLYFYNL